MVYVLTGRVWKGKGASSLWMPEYLPDLFPGTLNIKMHDIVPVIQWKTETYHEEYKRNFYMHPCTINDVSAWIIVPPLSTSRDNENGLRSERLLEIAHPEKLRQLLSLQDKDTVTISVDSH
jgi:CTP-dependent riboflavin kinase